MPIFKVGQTTGFKLDFFLLPVIFLIIGVLLKKIVKIEIYRQYFVLMTLVAISSIISNYIGGSYYLDQGEFRLPIKSFYVAFRVAVFIFFSYLVFKNYIEYRKILSVISGVFIISLMLGVFQFFDLFNARSIALDYYLERGGVQEYNFISFNRIIGVAPAIITWGGLSVLLFHFFLHLERRFILKAIGLSLAVVNVLASASRAAIAALVGSFLLILIVRLVFIDKKVSSFIKLSGIGIFFIAGAYLIVSTYLPDQLEFILKRFENAEEALTTSGRGEQLAYFSAIFNHDFFGKLFGVGESIVVQYGYLEIDFAYILYSTGIIGFFLHYSIIFLLLKEAYKYRESDGNLFLFVWGSTIGYLIFSFGFFFFYELYMGFAYWWLNGIAIGYLWLINRKRNSKTEF